MMKVQSCLVVVVSLAIPIGIIFGLMVSRASDVVLVVSLGGIQRVPKVRQVLQVG